MVNRLIQNISERFHRVQTFLLNQLLAMNWVHKSTQDQNMIHIGKLKQEVARSQQQHQPSSVK
jgi:hypothetical protein